MASLIYDSFLADRNAGNINPETDSFKLMLVTSAYTPNKGTHAKRSDVTNEVAAGGGYSAGGTAITVTRSLDTALHKAVLTFASVNWPTATITARGVVYKSRGGASSADELVYYVDFGSDIASTGGTFTAAQSTITDQN